VTLFSELIHNKQDNIVPSDFDNPSINNLVKSGDARIRASHKAILSSLKALWGVLSKLKLFFLANQPIDCL